MKSVYFIHCLVPWQIYELFSNEIQIPYYILKSPRQFDLWKTSSWGFFFLYNMSAFLFCSWSSLGDSKFFLMLTYVAASSFYIIILLKNLKSSLKTCSFQLAS